jgi:hypothetical protein
MLKLPAPPFEHLLRLSDGTGLFEHATGAAPEREHGYCTDDVARGLVVVLREPDPPEELRRLEAVYFAFLARAALPDGRFHNRLSATPERRFLDEVGSDDSIGRALWALGTAVHRGTSPGLRSHALGLFDRSAGFRSPSPRANAAAVLGAVEVLELHPLHRQAWELLEHATARLGAVAPSADWPWPEARLAYENARLPEARIAAGAALGDRRLLAEGLVLLDWLVETETRDDHFSFTPAGGWALGDSRPAFDQQPVEAGAMADACARAFDVTGEQRWADACLRAASWFVGANDIAVPLYDADTRGCGDGLGAAGPSGNEGAESTLALISALQQARRAQAVRSAARSAAVSTVAAPT